MAPPRLSDFQAGTMFYICAIQQAGILVTNATLTSGHFSDKREYDSINSCIHIHI